MHNKSTTRCGYVYLIGNRRFQWYKIGKSRTPKVRVTNIGVLLPFRVELFALWQVADCTEAESLLHIQYSANHINGEWFHFDDAELARVRKMAKGIRCDSLVGEFSNLAEDVICGLTPSVAKRKKEDDKRAYRAQVAAFAASIGETKLSSAVYKQFRRHRELNALDTNALYVNHESDGDAELKVGKRFNSEGCTILDSAGLELKPIAV